MYIFENGKTTGIKPSVATIGFFDGVHKGHQFLLEYVRCIAEDKGLRSTAITFGEHPRKVLHDSYQPQLLTTRSEKVKMLAMTGIDQTVVLDFTLQMAQLSAFDFMKTVLHDMLCVRVLVIGYDHRFGHNREEGFEDYVRYGKMIGIKVAQAPACTVKEVNVSSSVVRSFLQDGQVKLASECLGYDYFIEGTVVKGFQVGRTMGFPTANIQVDSDKLLPQNGVYAVTVEINKQLYAGMLNIGKRPTLNNGDNTTVEVHVLNWHGDLYGENLKLNFKQRIRDEKQFDSLKQLEDQLKKDSDMVKRMFCLYTKC